MCSSDLGEVVVLDESAAMLCQARLKGLTAVQGHAEQLPFEDRSFARVLMVDAFHHLLDQRRSAEELLRVLAPNGRIVVQEPNVERLSVRLVALAEKLALMRSHFLPPHAVKRLFEALWGDVRLSREGATFWAVVTKPHANRLEVAATRSGLKGYQRDATPEPRALRGDFQPAVAR